jgi:NAD-dependent deacetylase
VYAAQNFLEEFLEDNVMPVCPCGGVLKPNVILFGEQLPYKELQAAQQDARQCDCMLIIGSSLEVEPASSLPSLAKRNKAKIAIINLEETCMDNHADVVIHGDAAQVLPQILASLDD